MGIEDRKAREFRRREDDILAAARQLAGGDDWATITIDNIAERAEIGKGTLYKHFKSKDEVCARLVMDNSRELLARLRQVDTTLEYVPRVKTILRLIWQHNVENRDLHGLGQYCEISESSLTLSEEFAREFIEARSDFESFIHGLVEEGIARGILPQLPVPFLMAAAWSTLTGAIRQLMHGEVFTQLANNDEFLEYLTDYIMKGLMNAQAPSHNN